jgi:uncharacterized protein
VAAFNRQLQEPAMNFQNSIITTTLLDRVIDSIPARTHGIHGLPHWIRVERNGLDLARVENADPDVVSLFALFHDSRRINDDADPDHGPRGGRLAEVLFTEGLLGIDEEQLELLVYACANHLEETFCDNPTVACCWDADRLDLTRIGVLPDPDMLSTKAARSIALVLQGMDMTAFTDPMAY